MFASRIVSAFKMWMPTMPMTLVGSRNATKYKPATATFRVLPKMTKHEVKEYLTKIYNLPVVKVNTMNYMGKRKRVVGKRKVIYFKYNDFKKAIVTFGPSLKDLGQGAKFEQIEAEGK
mmetsp:Transcript_7001/g.10041  ORF Transcript_7001/g.10041 Transcript_7001/m.10041 type:complete len:118 (+) Transcript_7001:144-497(+)